MKIIKMDNIPFLVMQSRLIQISEIRCINYKTKILYYKNIDEVGSELTDADIKELKELLSKIEFNTGEVI